MVGYSDYYIIYSDVFEINHNHIWVKQDIQLQCSEMGCIWRKVITHAQSHVYRFCVGDRWVLATQTMY